MKKYLLSVLLITFIIPLNIFAYSNKIIVGGQPIGIEVHSKGIYVVGFYEINNQKIAEEAGFKIGDIITKIDNQEITSISSLNHILTDEKTYQFTIKRKQQEETIKLKLINEENTLKTGLYVKDQITGIGTLSYIDPETKIYGSLGHEILESTSLKKFELLTGKIYKAEITGIKKSSNNSAGEKNAILDQNTNYGTINKNEIEGIFGKYEATLPKTELYEVGTKEEIKKGKATIKTVISGTTVEEFDIEILALDEKDPVKNIYFEITDKNLLNKTGGVVQGMSGSPIIQNNKIIGVVNYVIINETNKGYGIYITTMLESGDKLLN